MGKTIGSLVQIGVGTVLEAVPGAQAIGASLVTSGFISLAATGLNSVFGPGKQRSPRAEQAIKSGTPVRVSAYGFPRSYRGHWA